MPSKNKHVPTYKSLIASNHPGSAKTSQRQPRSVNDLISNSRAERAARARHQSGGSSLSAWNPALGVTESNPLVGDHSIHPAELARLEAQDKRDASRRVSGPPPPRSWMLSKAQASTPPQLRPPAIVPLRSAGEIHLIRSLWSRHVLQLDVRHPVTARGPPSLFEATLTAILDWVGEEGREAGDGGMRDAIAWLDIPMRERLMRLAAEQGRGWSVADVRAICAAQLDDWHDDLEDASHHSTEEDWDVADDDTGSLKTLDLTASRQAHQLLLSLFKAPNVVVSVNTLTSLNLSSTSLDLSALVPLLPVGLRHLSLADVTFLDQVTVREWRALGKRLQVLNFLDLSFTPLSASFLSALLLPPSEKLTSLRRLGVKGWGSGPSRTIVDSDERLDPELRAVVRGTRRRHWIEILGDGPS